MLASIYKRLSSIVNKALATDVASMQRLAPWVGKVLRIEVQDFNWQVDVEVCEAGVSIKPVAKSDTEDTAAADVKMRADLMSFIAIARARGSSESLFKKKIHINGDVGFASDCQAILRDLKIDWEALLAEYIGDVAAHRLMQGASYARKNLCYAAESLAEQTQTYLQHEIKLLPTKNDLQDFTDNVQQCRDHCARLQARWQRMQEIEK